MLGQVLPYSRHILSILYCLPLLGFFTVLLGASHPYFTHHPPKRLFVLKGQTANFHWNYHVSNRDATFDTLSPRWSLVNSSGKQIIGEDYKYDSWKFKIHADCPSRLKNPTVRVSRVDPATLVIANVTRDDSGVYDCTLMLSSGNPISSQSELIVTETPKFTVSPSKVTTAVENSDLRITCTAEGPPTPNITWTDVTNSNNVSIGTGSATLQIANINRTYHGREYKCLASNNPNEPPITISTTIEVYCNTICAIDDDKMAIEMTDLTYGSSYENENSNEYKELRKAIETECFTVYSKAVQQVYSCIVTQFRKGSVIANIKITYPTGTKEPRKPLEDAIKTGTFAGQKVRTSFVSPTGAGEYTSPPTMTVKTSTASSPRTTFTSHGQPVSTIPCTESSHVPAIVLGVMFSISLVFNLLFIGHFVWKKRIKNKENRNNSSNYNETMYMNNIAFQDQRSNNEMQNIEPVISQGQQQPIPPVYQSVQVHTETYSSLSPNTKLPPKPAVITNSGDYEDLRGTSHQYQSLDGFSRV